MKNSRFKNNLKKVGIFGLALGLLISTGSTISNNSYASHHNSHWHWEKALSVKRADRNMNRNDRRNMKVRKHTNQITNLYKDLRQHHFTRSQSIVILALAKRNSPQLKNNPLKKAKYAVLPTYGYFNFIDTSKKPLIEFAKEHHENANRISTQFDYLNSRVSGYHFRHEHDTSVDLTMNASKKLFIEPPFTSKQTAKKYLNYINHSIQ